MPNRTPYRPIQMTVPETPSPEVLAAQQVALTKKAGPGRHVSDTTPSKGRLAKTQRLDDSGSSECMLLKAQPVYNTGSACLVRLHSFVGALHVSLSHKLPHLAGGWRRMQFACMRERPHYTTCRLHIHCRRPPMNHLLGTGLYGALHCSWQPGLGIWL